MKWLVGVRASANLCVCVCVEESSKFAASPRQHTHSTHTAHTQIRPAHAKYTRWKRKHTKVIEDYPSAILC